MGNGKEFAALGFGEVMMRLSPSGKERIGQSESFVKHAGGSELNVVSGISRLGLRCGQISKLPDNALGRYIRNRIRYYGVSDDHVVTDRGKDARLGVYYYESAVYPRKPQVVYDRKYSSFTTIDREEFSDEIYGTTELFHTSGISLALGRNARETALHMMHRFKAAGAKISFDVNYRASLWGEEEARGVILDILPLLDVLFISEETCRRMMGRTGALEDILRGFAREYDISVVASTQRKAITPSRHNFGSLLYWAEDDSFHTEAPYENIEVVDRIGSGDAYVSGVLYSLLSGLGPDEAVAFGDAMAAVKNTIPGDRLTTDLDEITDIINDHKNGSTSEMKR
ncbi:MAG: sugar kinase [Oscillospiraceae bacterium]